MEARRSLPRLLLALALALAGARGAAAALTPGWHRLGLVETGSHALVYVPAGLPAGPRPVVVFLHGQGGTPSGWQAFLQPVADELGVVLLLPKSDEPIGWGIGADDRVLEEALARLRAEVEVDPARLGIAGFSAGAAYAIEYAYSTRSPFVAVFAHSSPYRTVVRLADPVGPPPLRLHYGTGDFNYQSDVDGMLTTMLAGRGVAVTTDLAAGYDHDTWAPGSFRDGFAFVVGQPAPACLPAPTTLCLRAGRFRVEAAWDTGAASGPAQGVEVSDESGTFWFFSPENLELDVKVLDGCALNGRYWVFAAGLTNVETTITVTDTQNGTVESYHRAGGPAFQPIQDTSAFATCP
jgi:predicted esterase